MDATKTTNLHKQLCAYLNKRRIKQAIDILETLIDATSPNELKDELNDVSIAYQNMLSYTIDGIDDPERDKIFVKLIQTIFKLGDIAKERSLAKYSGWNTYWAKHELLKAQQIASKNIAETVDDLLFKSELYELLYPNKESNLDPNSESAIKHKELIKNIFNHFWLTDYYGEAEDSLIQIVFNSDKFQWYEVSIFISAITLSLLRVWQSNKLLHLFKIYNLNKQQLMERAMVGIVINLYYYDRRISFYPEILKAIKKSTENKNFRTHFKITVLQIIRSRETTILSKKLQDEILPKMAKVTPKIENEFIFDDILSDINDEKNPNWQAMFNDSEDIFKMMEELTKLQMEGADIYMSAFSSMKSFGFFQEMSNWFLPFYPDHESLNDVFKDDILGPGTNELAEAMYKTPYICNSDKYSLIYYLKYIPDSQKNMVSKAFRMELEGLQEMNNNDAIIEDPNNIFKINMTQYVQDLYRFFKLSLYKKEFEDIFSGELDIYNCTAFSLICYQPEDENIFADYFFDKNFFEDAKTLFIRQLPQAPDNEQLYEKIGYCYQKSMNYEIALQYYQKAELIKRNAWTLKKIGFCLRKLGNNEEALSYYMQANDMKPNDIHTTMMIGNCLIDLKEYKDALSYFFKIEYDNPTNTKVIRPIAYCYLAIEDYDDSKKYYDKIPDDELTYSDLINIGHIALCRGDKKQAVEFYRKSITNGNISKKQFIDIIGKDKEMLFSHGITEEDISLIIDYILFSFD